MTEPPAKGEAQYRDAVELIRRRGYERMGLHASWAWYDDPKRVVFSLSRYKFVAKMLEGAPEVLEYGCADGFASRIVAQAVGHLTCMDFDREFIESARETAAGGKWPIDFRIHDAVTDGPIKGAFDGIYCLDVFEHIHPDNEHQALIDMMKPLKEDGVFIIGMPSLESQKYASALSKAGHVNCKKQPEFKKFMKEYFMNVFMFSMNDEVVHTGFYAMAHYNFAVACGPRR